MAPRGAIEIALKPAEQEDEPIRNQPEISFILPMTDCPHAVDAPRTFRDHSALLTSHQIELVPGYSPNGSAPRPHTASEYGILIVRSRPREGLSTHSKRSLPVQGRRFLLRSG